MVRLRGTNTISLDSRILTAFANFLTEKQMDKNRVLERIIGTFLIEQGYLDKEFNFNDTPR